MANPTLPTLTKAQGEALSDQAIAASGSRYWKFGVTHNDDPSSFARAVEMQQHLHTLIDGMTQGKVVALGGRNIGVYACKYQIGGTAYTYAGDASLEAPANQANIHFYLDTAGVLFSANSAWPGTPHFKLAIVQTNASQVLSISDERFRNFQVGVANAWWTFPPQTNVDFNAKEIRNLGGLQFTRAFPALSGGIITPGAGVLQKISGAGDLFRIVPDNSNQSRLLILYSDDAINVYDHLHPNSDAWSGGGGTPTIELIDSDVFTLGDGHILAVMQLTTGYWQEVWRCGSFAEFFGLAEWGRNGLGILDIGRTSFKDTTKVIASGAIAVDRAFHVLDTESMGAADDLDNITGGMKGQMLILTMLNAGRVVTVRHNGGGAGNIRLQNSKNLTMTIPGLLVLLHDGTHWVEWGRLPLKLSDLTQTGQVIPYPLDFFIAGTPAGSTTLQEYYCTAPFKLIRAAGRAKTAPSGGSCVLRILKNGASVHANDAAAINIANGTNHDVCDDVSVDFAISDILAVQSGTVNAAADIGVTIEARIDARA